jgi:DNA-binding transcriptional LysR family regulator
MRFKKLDLNLLIALDHMIELRSVSAAAEKMFMSQSAMSNALMRLRTYFDDPLLVQVGKKMEVTPRAEAMRGPIRDILVRIEATIDSQPDFDPTTSTREFSILLSDYVMRVLMPIVFRKLNALGATIKFSFRPPAHVPQTMLEQGEIDLLITPSVFVTDEHPADLLFNDRYVVAAWQHGKYGKVTMDKATYESASHAIMSLPNAAKSGETYFLEKHGVQRRVDAKSFSFTTLPHLITGTDRVATIHASLARLQAAPNELVIYPMPVELPPLEIMMQWHAYRDTDHGIIWLRDMLRQAASEIALY